jgi:release factor glutamine methyltransferase
LTPGGDGLSEIRVLASGAAQHLKPGGWLLVEHGFDQAGDVRAIFLAAGLREVSTARDLEDRDRITLGRAR